MKAVIMTSGLAACDILSGRTVGCAYGESTVDMCVYMRAGLSHIILKHTALLVGTDSRVLIFGCHIVRL